MRRVVGPAKITQDLLLHPAQLLFLAI